MTSQSHTKKFGKVLVELDLPNDGNNPSTCTLSVTLRDTRSGRQIESHTSLGLTECSGGILDDEGNLVYPMTEGEIDKIGKWAEDLGY